MTYKVKMFMEDVEYVEAENEEEAEEIACNMISCIYSESAEIANYDIVKVEVEEDK